LFLFYCELSFDYKSNSPPPALVASLGGQGLLWYLRPRIQSICVNLYPSNPSAADDNLCTNILRDSLDPGALALFPNAEDYWEDDNPPTFNFTKAKEYLDSLRDLSFFLESIIVPYRIII